MEVSTMKKKINVLEHAFAASAGAYYNINLTRDLVNTAIEKMENPEERLLLKYCYLKNESWEDISYELNVSYRTVHRIHASALNNFVVPE